MFATPTHKAFAKPRSFTGNELDLPRISVVGLGYVGAVSTACLSDLGHRVVGVDVDTRKVDAIAAGTSPILEKDLEELLSSGVQEGRITAGTDLADAVRRTDVTFVSVGTPTADDGGCDCRYIEAAARSMGEGLSSKDDFHVFVMRCSIPPGTTMGLMTPIIEEASGKKLGVDFGVVFNPEFLREGVAIADFHSPPKTVIGASCERSAEIVAAIYRPVDSAPVLTSIEVAEMVKYVDNVWHATKVTFANEVGRLSKSQGVDSHEVMDIFVRDTKLNLSPYYLKPGFAYGGSCLPKEVRAVTYIAASAGVDLPLVSSLEQSNRAQIDDAIRLTRETGAKKVGILGLTFKPGTDDLRESPILEVVAALHAEGKEVVVYDPAFEAGTDLTGHLGYAKYGSKTLQDLVPELSAMLRDSADAVVEATETVIVTHGSAAFADVIAKSSNKNVVDLARLPGHRDGAASYSGIGW